MSPKARESLRALAIMPIPCGVVTTLAAIAEEDEATVRGRFEELVGLGYATTDGARWSITEAGRLADREGR